MVAQSASPVPAILCQHHTLETLAQPRWQGHANGAEHLTECTIASRGPRHVAAHLGQRFGVIAGAAAIRTTWMCSPPGRVAFRVFGPAGLRRWHPQLGWEFRGHGPCVVAAVEVSDLRRTTDCFRDSGITVAADAGQTRAFVAPRDAHGVAIEPRQARPAGELGVYAR